MGSFPNNSSGGLDGLRPQHPKDLTSAQSGHPGEQLIDCLTVFAIVVLNCQIPEAIRPVFCGASLFALPKKTGGIRPIAAGCALRHLVVKVAVRCVNLEVAERLSPHQTVLVLNLAPKLLRMLPDFM